MCISILTITTLDSAKNTMAKLTCFGFFIIVLTFAIFGSLIYLSYFANDNMMHAFAASENSTSNETSSNENANPNANPTGNFTVGSTSNISTPTMNTTNATTITAPSNSNFSTPTMNTTNVTTITAPSNSNFSTSTMNTTNATTIRAPSNSNFSSPTMNTTNATTIRAPSNSNVTLLYEYPDLGLKIKYPPSWEKVQYGRAIKAYGEGVIANLLSPLESSADKFRDYVIIKIENLTARDLGKRPANNSIGGNPTYQSVFNRPNLANKSDTITTFKEWTPVNDKAFVIEFSAEKSRYARYLPLAMEIINSIEMNGIASTPASTSTNQSNQSQQLSPANTSSTDQGNLATENNTKTSSVIDKLLKRDIDKNETNFESLPNSGD